MRIVLTVADLSVGGAEMNVVNFATTLRNRGHAVYVVAGGGPLLGRLQGAGIRHVASATRLRRPWSVLKTAVRLARLARTDRIDVVHSFMASTSVAATLASKSLGRRSFALVAAPPGVVQDRHEPRWLSMLRMRLLTLGADLVLAPSPALAAALRDAGVAEDRVRSLGFNATIMDRYDPRREASDALRRGLRLDQESRVVCSVARLHPYKGQDVLLRAAPQILQTIPNACFLLVGDGAWRSHLEGLAVRLEVADAVRFAGARDDVPDLLALCTVLAQTTVADGGPGLSVIEAWAAGRPVVATETRDLRHAVGDSGAAILVPRDDPHALADALIKVLRDPEAAEQMGARGRELAEREYDLVHVTEELEHLYAEALVRRHPGV